MQFDPYIHYKDNAEEAITFYQSIFGGELELSRFSDIPGVGGPDEADKVVHASLATDADFMIMASDTPSQGSFKLGNNVSLSLSGGPADDSRLRGYFDELADGGEVVEPLAEAPWGGIFGMVRDRFDLLWMFTIATE